MSLEKAKAGVIGIGTWGGNHAWAYSDYERSDLVAVADLNGELAKSVADQYGAPKYFTDYKEMLEEVELDLVSVVTPDHLHRQVVEDCAKAGVNILLEKPTATNMDDCNAILKAAKDAEIKFMTDYILRWDPVYATARKAVDEGYLGEPIIGHATLNDTIFVPKTMLKWSKNSSPLYFLVIHIIDIMRWVIQQEVKEVYAKVQRRVLKGMGIDTDDAIQAMLTFENGGTFVLQSNWIQTENFPGLVEQDFEIAGTKGVIQADRTNQGLGVYSDPFMGSFPGAKGYPLANLGILNLNGRMSGILKSSTSHFVDCVLDDQQPLVTLEDSRATTEIMCAIADSMESGKTVKL